MNNFDVGILKPSELSYEWKVTDFSTRSTAAKDRLLSPVFLTKWADNTMQWRLSLYPNGKKDEDENYLSIFLEHIGESSVIAQVDFSILNAENKNILKHVMGDRLFMTLTKSWGYRKFVNRSFILDERNGVLENDTLKILCEIHFNPKSIVEESFTVVNKKDAEEDRESHYRLKEFDDFGKLLESEAFSDMTFVVEEKKIHAHKAILVSRSPVFELMLQRYTKDNQFENTFEISGIKYDAMKELLRFMYVGKVNNIDEQATDLLIAADKYSVAGLKALCEKVLCKNLDIDNALEYLNLATVCDAAVLKSQIIEFIANNLEDVVEKPEFDLFGDLDSKVICEVVRAIAKKNSKE